MKTAVITREKIKLSSAYHALLKSCIDNLQETLETLLLMEGASSATLLQFKNIQLPHEFAFLLNIPLRMEPLITELETLSKRVEVAEKTAVIRECLLRAKSYITAGTKYLQQLDKSSDFKKTITYKKKLELKQEIPFAEYARARKGWVKLHYTAGNTLSKAHQDLKRALYLSQQLAYDI